jgi:hypothetical protein
LERPFAAMPDAVGEELGMVRHPRIIAGMRYQGDTLAPSRSGSEPRMTAPILPALTTDPRPGDHVETGEEWQPIATAPKDGTPFQARIPGHGEDNIIAWACGLLDEQERDCGSWYFADDQEPPPCWTDGVCWALNEDGEPSAQPTHWKALRP